MRHVPARLFTRFALALGSAAVLLGPGAAAAQNPPEVLRALTVSGFGQVTASPDQAVVTLAIETEAEEAAEAVAENARRTEQVIAAVRGLLGEDDRLVTTGYSLQPRYYHPPRPEPIETPRIVGYRARNQVRVELRALEDVGRVIDASITAGANRVDQLQFVLEERGPAMRSALAAAAAEARAQAQSVAEALGVALGPVLEATTAPSPRVAPRFARAEAMMDGPVTTPIEPGEVTVTTTLQVTYAIE